MASEDYAVDLQKRAMLASCLPQQRAAILDPNRLKALFCPRRSGKSFCDGIYLFYTALSFPNSSCLYLGLTKDTAEFIMNAHVFEVINERFCLGARWNATRKFWFLPNKSRIYMRGADANHYEIRKTVGQKYRLALLDEASKYRFNVEEMVYESLLPAMGDDRGTIVMSGTPSNVTTGLFFDATNGKKPGWSLHHWDWRQNTFAAANIQELHDDILAKNPAFALTPSYRQEWLGEWVIDRSALVYRWRDDLNTSDALPLPKEAYTYGLGVDLGFVDPTAVVVVAYSPKDPTLYVVHAEKREKQNFTDVAEWIKSLWYEPTRGLRGAYPFEFLVMDAADLQGVEELRRIKGLPEIQATKKKGKEGVIAALNGELLTQRVKLLPAAMALADEWQALIWDEKKLQAVPQRWEEDSRMPNHLADAALYAWRKARNYDVEVEAPPKPKTGTKEWLDAELDREIAKVARPSRARPWGVNVNPKLPGPSVNNTNWSHPIGPRRRTG